MEFAKQSAYQPDEEDVLQFHQNDRQSTRVQSTYFEAYRQLLNQLNIDNQISGFVPTKDADFNPNYFHPYSFWVVREFNQYQVVTLSVQLGGFALNLKIYNVDRNSPFSSQQTDAEGKFGKVHGFTFLDQKIVVKSIQCLSTSEQGRRTAISKAVREYFRIALLSLALKQLFPLIAFYNFPAVVYLFYCAVYLYQVQIISVWMQYCCDETQLLIKLQSHNQSICLQQAKYIHSFVIY